MDHWRKIYAFPGYSVSYTGDVRNDLTGYWLQYSINQAGVVYVGITKGRTQYNRSVARLVADAFLPLPMYESFDTPINLDGNRLNNFVNNLIWRPRWFAVKYNRQFFNTGLASVLKLRELATGEIFNSSLAAAVRFGLLAQDLAIAALNQDEVWPTGQRFAILK